MPTGSSDRRVEHATCLGCGCACDDIDLVVRRDRIVETGNACSLGAAWFGDGRVPARARVAGRDAPIGAAIDAAARLMTDASRPLVYLAPDISCEAQREGVALADALRATLDTVTSATAIGSILAAQERGRAGATLGEIRHRADVVLFWGIDPALRYPRYAARYAPDAPGLQLPGGRRSRTVIAVDVGDARGPEDADVRLSVPVDEDVSTLTLLRAMIGGSVDARYTGVMAALLAARYAVIVADGEPPVGAPPDPARSGALIALAQALNGPTRCALSTLRAGGNRSGADAVLTWQTGYPAAVDFSRGFPSYRPQGGAAGARLSRGEVDALLVLGAPALIPDDLLALMAGVPCAVVGPRASESALGSSRAVIDTGVAGIHEAGTVFRMDDVPLTLRPALQGSPATVDVARALRERALRESSRTIGV